MKNVRLFAVAASLGMFASVVSAAEPKTTVKWSDVPSVIKVDVDQKVIATTPTATVTASEEKVTTGSIYAVKPATNSANGWLYSNAIYWTNADDAYNVLGLGGYRFLAPGSDEVEDGVFVDQFNGVVYANEEEAFKALENMNYIQVTNDEDGYIQRVVLDYAAPAAYNAYTESYIEISVDKTGSRADADVMEAVVDFYVNGVALAHGDNGRFDVENYTRNVATRTNTLGAGYTVNVFDEDKTVLGSLTSGNITTLAQSGLILTVDYSNKKGYTLDDASVGNFSNNLVAGQTKTLYNALVTPTAFVDSTVYYADKAKTVSTTSAAHASADQAEATMAAADNGKLVKAGSTSGKWIHVKNVADATHIVIGGEVKALANVYVDATAEADITDLTSTTTYKVGSSSGSYSFKGSAIKFWEPVSVTPIDNDYYVASSGQLDKIYLQTYNTTTLRTTYVAYDYNTTDIYWIADGTTTPAGATSTPKAGTKVKVTKKNASNLFTYEMFDSASGKFYIGDTAVGKGWNSTYKAAVTPVNALSTPAAGDTGWFGAKTNDSDYSKVSINASGTSVALNAITARSAAVEIAVPNTIYFTVGDVLDTLYEAGTDDVYKCVSYTNPSYNALTRLAQPGYLTVVDITDADDSAAVTGTINYMNGSAKVTSFEIVKLDDLTLASDYAVVLGDDVTLASTDKRTAVGTASNAGHTQTNSIYEITNVPENDTEYYVLLTSDSTGFDIRETFSYSAAKETGIVELPDGTEVSCKAVQLEKNGAWYPAFATQEELNAVVKGLTGLNKALSGALTDRSSTYKTWATSAQSAIDSYLSIVDVKDVTNDLVQNLTIYPSAETTETKVVDSTSTDVKVTSNLETIDTSVAGIKTLTYTATYKDEVVGTKDVTVVVAPKYLRTYKNGRVATLTSYYVSNTAQRYAEYVYDWDKMEATVTYYSADDVVVTTEVLPLK